METLHETLHIFCRQAAYVSTKNMSLKDFSAMYVPEEQQ